MSSAVLSHLNARAEIAASELLTRAEAAAYIGCRPQTLAVWATTHRYNLPYVKVGALVRYRKRDLDAFLERRTIGGDSAE